MKSSTKTAISFFKSKWQTGIKFPVPSSRLEMLKNHCRFISSIRNNNLFVANSTNSAACGDFCNAKIILGENFPIKTQCRYYAANYWGRTPEREYPDTQLAEWQKEFKSLAAFSIDALRAWRRVFDLFDKDNDGFISQADLQKRPEFSLTKAQKIKDFDVDRNNLIDFGEFVPALYELDKEILKETFEGFNDVDLQIEFEKYAVISADGSKFIPLDRVESLMKDNKFTCVTACDTEKLFKEMDVNHDGQIDLNDFKQWLGFP